MAVQTEAFFDRARAMKGTVKSKRDVERLFREGRRSSSYLMMIVVFPVSPENPGRWGFIAGKKIGAAPVRSRCKRVLRAAAYELGGPWKGYDVLFVARRKAAFAAHGKLVGNMSRQLKDMGVI